MVVGLDGTAQILFEQDGVSVLLPACDTGRNQPAADHDHVHGRSRQMGPAAGPGLLAADQPIGEQHEAGHKDADRSLGQRSEAQGSVAAAPPAQGAAPLGVEGAPAHEHSGRDEEREQGVEHPQLGEVHHQHGAQRGEARRPGRGPAIASGHGEVDEQQSAQGHQYGDDSSRVVADSGLPEEPRQPEEQGRLLHVDLAVELGENVLPQHRHLPRDLHVARLVRVPQVAGE